MFPWRPITIRLLPPNTIPIEEALWRTVDKAYRKHLVIHGGKPRIDPSKILHFRMIDANTRRLQRYKGRPLSRRCGHRKLRGWTEWMLANHTEDMHRYESNNVVSPPPKRRRR